MAHAIGYTAIPTTTINPLRTDFANWNRQDAPAVQALDPEVHLVIKKVEGITDSLLQNNRLENIFNELGSFFEKIINVVTGS